MLPTLSAIANNRNYTRATLTLFKRQPRRLLPSPQGHSRRYVPTVRHVYSPRVALNTWVQRNQVHEIVWAQGQVEWCFLEGDWSLR